MATLLVLSDAPAMPPRDNSDPLSDDSSAASGAGMQAASVDIAEPLLVKAFTAAKRRASVLEHKEPVNPLTDALADSSSSILAAADAPLPAKRPMLQHTRSPPLATRTLFHAAASHAQLIGDFVPVRPVDSARFESQVFPIKHVTHQPAATDSSLVGAPQLQLDGVSLVPFIPPALPAAPLPHVSAPAVRPRFKLKPPPTPQPSMCIPAHERVEELFGNKLLRRRGQGETLDATAPLVDDDADSVPDDAAATPCLDIHASPAFTSTRTYSSQDPFAHTQARNGGSFIFERDFCSHKNVGCGSFFEVFRVEAAEPAPVSNVDHTRQQRQFEQFSMELERRDAHSKRRPSLSVTTAAVVKPRSNRRVYAIKKSLRPFRSEYDRACLLRETNILALINQSLIEPPPSVVAKFAAASAAGAASASSSSAAPPPAAPVAHRNPFLLKWYQTWQESGFFFEQIEYCTCNLAELIFVLMETPPTPSPTKAGVITAAAAASASPSPPSSPSSDPPSYFHQHLPRLFLSLLTQITLALHTLHTQAGGGIVHLDIKPDNILLNRRGKKVLLSDYGFAKQLSELQRDADAANPGRRGSNEEIEGDSVYMAPELLDDPDDDDSDDEQMSSSAPERQSSTDSSATVSTPPRSRARAAGPTTKCDLFSLGLLLFEMVSNSELPPSGFLWQQLRQGAVTTYLPLFEDPAPLDASLSDAPLPTPVVSQSHLGRDVHTSEVQQNGITAWMVSVIENLLSPLPSARMSASELLVAIERKLLLLGWIDAPEDGTRSDDAETRASELAFAWTSVLPPCLALPDVASLNFSALIQRAQEMELPPATPTPLAGTAMQFAFAETASPCFVRQRSSPSPSRSGSGFFAGAKLGPRISPVPFAAPVSAATLSATQPLSATHTRLGVTPLRQRQPKMMHSRSVSVGVGSIEAMLSAAPAAGHTLTVPENCTTPSLLRRSIVQRSPSARDLSSAADTSNLSPPKSRSATAHGATPVDAAAASSSGSSRVSLAGSALPPIQVPLINRLERFQPLSPFKLNSPARKTASNTASSSHKSHQAMAQAAEAEIARAATIAHTSPSSGPIAAALSSPQPSSHSPAVPAHSRALFQSASPYLDGGVPTPPLRPRAGSIFGSLVSAASSNPQHQPQSSSAHPLSPPLLMSQASGSMLLAPSSSASTAVSSSSASSSSSTGSMFGSPRVSSVSHHGLSMFGHARAEHHAMMALAASVGPAATVASPIFRHLQQCNNNSRSDIAAAPPDVQ